MVLLVHHCPGRARYRLPAGVRLHAASLRDALDSLPGVERVRLNPRALSVIIHHDPQRLPLDRLSPLVARLARAAGQADPDPDGPRPGLVSRQTGSGPPDATPLVMAGALLVALPLLPNRARAALTLAHVSGTLGRGVRATLTQGLTVEGLDALAVTLSILRRDWVTATVTQGLLSLASYVEGTTRRAADETLVRLLRPPATEVCLETNDGRLRRVPAHAVQPGDRVVVTAGDTIAVDGRVAQGVATVTQAAVTGESLPIPKETGAAVICGSVVLDGRLVVIAERTGDATTMARIAHFVREALADDTGRLAMAARLADQRVSVTLVSGLALFLLTRDIRRLEALFLVDFSCAVKLGTSVAIRSALSAAARDGALIKGGTALEALATADTVVFDKTGTLTHDTLEVTDIRCLGPRCRTTDDLLALVASIAEHTTHPVAAAVVDLAHRRHLAHIGHEEVDFVIGHGLAAQVGDQRLVIGSRHYLEEHEGIPFAPFRALLDDLADRAGSLLFVGSNGAPHGVIALKDRMRAEAPAIVAGLRAEGLDHLVMITGDHGPAAHRLGAHLGLDAVHSRIAPEDKARIVQSLRDQGRRVVFVGDGVNDAPALMTADAGVAMPRGAEIARATADVVLTTDDLAGVLRCRRRARETFARIERTARVAVAINTLVMLGAALGRLPPVWTAVLHNGTTIGVLIAAWAGARTPTPAPMIEPVSGGTIGSGGTTPGVEPAIAPPKPGVPVDRSAA